MATKYWRVGGTNTWSSTANWSTVSPSGATGAAIPVIGDDVVISNVGQTAGTINIGATATAKLNSWTVIGGTWTVAGATQVNIAGTFDCQNVTWTNTGLLSLQGTGASYDITASGTTFGCAVTLNAFNVASSSFNLLSAFTTGATQTTTLTAGTLILNNFTLTTGIFNSAATNVRAITFGTGNIALIHTTAATAVVSLANYSNFSCSGTGGFTSAMSVTRTFTFGSTGATNTNSPNLALTSGASVPTFAAGSWFKHLNFTGSTFTLAALTVNVNSLTLASGGTYTALTAIMVGTGTITPNGKTIAALTINHTTISITTLGGALSVGVTGTTTLTQGTLDLGGFTLTTGIFSSSNTNTRAIAFGTGNIVLSHTTAATVVLAMATATFFNCTGTGGFTVAAMSNTRTFTFGTTGTGWSNAPNLTFTTGASVATITTLGSFNKLNFGTTSFNPGAITVNVASLTLSSTGTYTTLTVIAGATGTVPRVADGTILSNGKTILAFTLNHTNTAGTTTLGADLSLVATGTTTLTAGTLALGGNFLTTGIFSSTGTGTRVIAFGAGNIVLAHTSAGQTVLNMATATGFTWTGTGGFTATMNNTRIFTFGTTGGTTSNAPNLTLSSGASIATLTTGSWFNTLNFGTTSFILGTTALNLNALTLSTSGSVTSYNLLTATMVGTGTMTTGTRGIAALTINHTGTTTLAANLLILGALTLTQGTLSGGISYNIQTSTFASTGTATRSITSSAPAAAFNVMGSGATAFSNASAAGITIVGFLIQMNSDSAKTFAGGGGSYSTLVQSYTAAAPGVLTISGNNSFANLKYNTDLATLPATVTFTISTTQTFTDFTLSGTAGNLKTINSSTANTQATLSKSSGTVSVDYVSIKDSNATGGATWYAGANSVDAGNNTGWIFTAPPGPSTNTGNFFLFFN